MAAVWDFPDFDDHDDVHFFHDRASGLKAIIAIHSTALGPAAGGVRFWRYHDQDAAITDALRLSRGMSYKNAMAGLPMGGGKGVILADASGAKSPEQIEAFGRAIESLNGRYVTAEDVGITEADMARIARQTRYVSGLPGTAAGCAGGDPGPFTATGVFLGVKAAWREATGHDNLKGVHVAIQGVGSVGGGLARHLADAGAVLTIADADEARAATLAAALGAKYVPAEQILQAEVDIVSPNALGAVLNEKSIAQLRAPVVAGGANNQLATPADADRLHVRNIVYAPDYVINAGGIINVALEYLGRSSDEVTTEINAIPERLAEIWAESRSTGLPAAHVADAMAQRLIGR